MKLFKKIMIFVVIAGLLGIGYFIYTNVSTKHKISKIKEGWHVEILNDFINIRTEPSPYTATIGKVNKGEVYKVLETNLKSSSLYWFKIELDKGTGWIASNRKNPFVNDVNNPTDIVIPTLKYFEEEYNVYSIEDINYKHLEISDNKDDYEVSHKIYHEVNKKKKIDQYWIVYHVEDKAGNYIEKTQKIIFTVNPSESEVYDFKLLGR